jgi:threonine/homoserine/homoserine lactone efflux protein
MPQVIGVSFGLGLMLLLMASGLAAPFVASPLLHGALRWIGGAWIVFLAWKIATQSGSSVQIKEMAGPSFGFVGTMLFQWTNPKAWVLLLSAAATYVEPGTDPHGQAAALAAIYVLVCIPCVVTWAVLGGAAGHILTSPLRLRLFNCIMAVLLVASVLPTFSE